MKCGRENASEYDADGRPRRSPYFSDVLDAIDDGSSAPSTSWRRADADYHEKYYARRQELRRRAGSMMASILAYADLRLGQAASTTTTRSRGRRRSRDEYATFPAPPDGESRRARDRPHFAARSASVIDLPLHRRRCPGAHEYQETSRCGQT